jgi:sugar lactone lactonase YvrE
MNAFIRRWSLCVLSCSMPLALAGCWLDFGGDLPGSFPLGGSVSGLNASGLVLANGTDTLSVDSGATSFTMPGSVLAGAAYSIHVQAQPAGMTCSVAAGSGTMPAADMRNAVVTCSANAYRLGGSLSGLTTSGLVLANGADTLSVGSGSTSFTLPASVASGSSYAVTVQTQPAGQTCSVNNGSGQMGTADVTSVALSCTDQPFTVGGSISGLATSGLVLANGSSTLTVAAGATTFTLPAPVSYGAPYAITVQAQPTGLSCSVANGSGTMGAANATNVALTCAANSYSLGGTISGLTSPGLVLANGSDVITVAPQAGSFTMSNPVTYGGSYAVTVQTQPTGLTCSLAHASGTMGAGNVTSAAITCAANSYTLGGTISGLSRSGLVLANGSDTLAVAANASTFTMSSPVAYGGSFAMTVQAQPTGQTCSLANAAGGMGAANETRVEVTCTANRYAVGGSISGLTRAGLVLANGTDTLSVDSGATSFTMPGSVLAGAAYSIHIQAQPAGMTCSVAAGSGTMPAADMRNAVVTCSANAYRLGGSLSGLTTSGLVLANGADTLSVGSGSTSFTLPASVASGSSYAVTVQTQPAGQTCSVNNGSGQMGTADVTSVALSCTDQPFTVGGSISGLATSGLVLANGSSTLTVAAGATTFTLPAPVSYGAPYAITVQAQPTGLSCSVANGAGTMGAANVTNVALTCSTNSYSVSGTISGLTATGLVLANGSDTLGVAPGSAGFTMDQPVAYGGAYGVTVQTQPAGQTCSVANGAGTMGAAQVTNVAITCSANSYTLGGSISGLNNAGLVLTNGSDTLAVAANATSFTMPTSVAFGASYAVTVATQPNWLSCSVTSGTGTMGTAAVSNVAVSCVPSVHVSTVAGSGTAGVTDATGTAAQFDTPSGIAVDANGNIYVADQFNHKIRKIAPSGVVTTLAGSGNNGDVDGTGSAAEFSYPFAVVVDAAGTVYVTDEGNHKIRRITPAGVVTTLAGSGWPGYAEGTGSAAEFDSPEGLALDADGDLYVAERGNHIIRKVTPAGVVTTLAGSGSQGSADGLGTAASFNAPTGVAVDGSGNVYVTDLFGHKVRKISAAGAVSTLAGSNIPGSTDATGTAASFTYPAGIAVDASGTLYVSTYGGNTVRKISPAGVVTTYAGTGSLGSTDGTALAASFTGPIGLALDAAGGTLYVADSDGHKIRRISNAP